MDDYNVNVLSEAKNEYSSRLLNILTPLILEGIKSIFDEAVSLCQSNDEDAKYLMTFQNFLTRVPKWNSNIIDEESKRISKKSECPYLTDLLTCVHITQLKVLTSIRVSQKQKKIDIDIPKLNTFIHKVYIELARKLYSNVYLYEKDILPLQYQKNRREVEILCRESILNVIRESVPVEKILRAYIDETVDEEIIEEIIEKKMTDKEAKEIADEIAEKKIEKENKEKEKDKEDDVAVKKIDKEDDSDNKDKDKNDFSDSFNDLTKKLEKNKKFSMKMNIPKPSPNLDKEKKPVEPFKNNINLDKPLRPPSPMKLSFNDKDSVLDMGTNKSTIVNAPKDIPRLEKIATENMARRKAEDEEDDDDYDDGDKLTIHSGDSINLKIEDIGSLDKKMKLDQPKLDVEILT
tara:strand:- start:732 stop:1946 length:1215 start_codon:yes stop_codon:yes gene_type:complete